MALQQKAYKMFLKVLIVVTITNNGILYTTAVDPCNTIRFLNDYKRSTAYGLDDEMNCDNMLHQGWYRITSGAGDRMPTKCIQGKCNTVGSVWLSNDSVGDDEDIFPALGVTVNRTAYSSSLYKCHSDSFNIQIKGCDGFLVYHLVPTKGCNIAYCFGDQLPCPPGKSSETGFTPNCGTSTNYTRKPFVTTELTELPGTLDNKDYVFSNITFTCRADDLDDVYSYNVKWYISELVITAATMKNLTKADIVDGNAKLHQKDWTSLFRPSFIVKCSIRVLGNGFSVPGPENFSEPLFAGIRTYQTEYRVSETKTIQIPVQLTIPLPCGWPVSVTNNTAEKKMYEDQCQLNLLNHIPRYQQNVDLCNDGISHDDLLFDNQQCGVAFNYSAWSQTSYLKITGAADNLVNLKDRLVFLRLYNNPNNVLPNQEFLYMFNGITLPDIKVSIQDNDNSSLGVECRSVNDPHMYTFDNPNDNWELQKFCEGEYVMYQHKKLPLQINAYFRKCNKHALCNCGLAVRSAESLFIANFCETKYKNKTRVNRYIVNQLCDEESFVVTETGNKIEIILPTGTKVDFTHDKVYDFYGLNTISIYPSFLDYDLTQGLCGTFNRDKNDDFIPRGEFKPNDKAFVESWRVPDDNKNGLSLFQQTKELPKVKYFGNQYCTCKVNDSHYPHESPKFSCNLTSAMKTCRNTKTATSVIQASCKTSAYNNQRSKKSVDVDNEEDMFSSFPLVNDDTEPRNVTVEWRNGWTEDTAREFCSQSIINAPSYGPCMEYVPYMNPTSYITTCILDIKLQGGTEWIKSTLDSFNGDCMAGAKRSENLTRSTTTSADGKTRTLFDIIEEATCPNNCSGHGVCVKGECNCTTDYFGYDCATVKSTPPDIIPEAFEGECDLAKRPCRKFTIPGYNFIKGSLVCNFTSYALKHNGTDFMLELEESFTHPGIYKSSFLMYCELPPSKRKRSIDSGSAASIVYTITISNNGIDFTEELKIMVFDSNCYICNTISLSCKILDECKIESTELDDVNPPVLTIVLPILATTLLVVIIGFICFKKDICNRIDMQNMTGSVNRFLFRDLQVQENEAVCERFEHHLATTTEDMTGQAPVAREDIR